MSEKSDKSTARSPLNIESHINKALKSSDISAICSAIGDAARQHTVSGIAKKSGMKRSTIYRAFSGGAHHANFKTVLNVLNAMGLELKVFRRR
jgi:probable addiction module antidote protein